MPLLPILLVAQIIFSVVVVNLSPTNLSPAKHQIKNVLGVKIAQEDTTATDQSTAASESNPPPSEEKPPAVNPPAPETQQTSEPSTPPQTNPMGEPTSSSEIPTTNTSEQTQATHTSQELSSTPQPESSNTQSGQSTETPTEVSQQLNTLSQILDVSPAPTTEQIKPSEPPSSSPNLEIPQLQQTISQNMAVLNPQELTSSPENINPQSNDEANKEEEKLNQITDPKKQIEQLIINSVDKVKDIHENLVKDDFSTANFASQRFNDQIDRALDSLQSLPKIQADQFKKQMTKFCNQADLVLRNAQLAVPEDLEQDLEINRGRCLETQL